jgi:hypothetical protein
LFMRKFEKNSKIKMYCKQSFSVRVMWKKSEIDSFQLLVKGINKI